MKLKSEYITQEIDGTLFLVAIGSESFRGIVKSNSTAAYIINLLKNEITLDEIAEAIYAKYDAPMDTIVADMNKVINSLRSIKAIEE